MRFVYMTTAQFGREKRKVDRIGNTPLLEYWNQAKHSRDSCEAITEVLGKKAPAGSLLASYLERSTPNQVFDELISNVTWLVGSPDATELERQLSDALAEFASRRANFSIQEARNLLAPVVLRVIKTSAQQDAKDRTLRPIHLLELFEGQNYEMVYAPDIERLRKSDAFVRNLPIHDLDSKLRVEIDRLTAMRFFEESGSVDLAEKLSVDLRNDGRLSRASEDLRAAALAWCARVLASGNLELAKDLIVEAKSLSTSIHIIVADAMIVRRTSVSDALALIGSEMSPPLHTARYLARNIERDVALTWLRDTRLSATDFDPDGQFVVLIDQLEEQQWSEAMRWFESIPEESFEICIALSWAAALTLLAWALPEHIRFRVQAGPPIKDELQLRSSVDALVARKKAVAHFLRFARNVRKLELEDLASTAEEYALWLTWEDRTTRSVALMDLTRLLQKSEHDVRWVPMALRAGLDLRTTWDALLRTMIVCECLDFQQKRALTSFILYLRPEKWLNSWPKIKSVLAGYCAPDFLTELDIKVLLYQGRVADARLCLQGAGAVDLRMLEGLEQEIQEAEGSVQDRGDARALPVQIDDPVSLESAVAKALHEERWASLESLALQLFERTQSVRSAERYVLAIEKLWKHVELADFLSSRPELIAQSPILTQAHFMALFYLGRWSEASSIAREDSEALPEQREIQFRLAVHSGEWDQLENLLSELRLKTDDLPTDQLRFFAEMSIWLGKVELSKCFAKAAVNAAPEDAYVLAHAYVLAVRGRWDQEPQVNDWLGQAISRSGQDGPMQRRSLSDLIEEAPRWRRRLRALTESILSADLPLAAAAQQVNRPLAMLTMAVARQNRQELHPHRRPIISAFSGQSRKPLSHVPRKIVLDASALLTLADLRVLTDVLKAFDTIYVPHSTAAWLLVERGQIEFHQPSRVADARTLVDCIARDEVQKLKWHGEASRRLRSQVGNELAELIAAAQNARAAGSNAFVIRATPLYRDGSLMETIADLGNADRVMQSTLSVARSLTHHGVISGEILEQSLAFLSQHDDGWPHDEIIPEGSIVYVDDMAVQYLQRINALQLLHQAGFKVIIHNDVASEADSLLKHEHLTASVVQSLESVRAFLVDGQKTGRVRSMPLPAPMHEEPDSLSSRTAFDLLHQLFERAPGAEVVIVDDRAINKFEAHEGASGESVLLRTSLDVLDWLLAARSIDQAGWLRLRTELRKGGYLLVPVTSGELIHAVRGSQIESGQMIESVEARAIRENILLAQMSSVVVLPAEGHWLANHTRQVLEAVAGLWSDIREVSHTIARSEWLVRLGRVDAFAGRFSGHFDNRRWAELDAMAVVRLVLNINIAVENKPAYNDWIQTKYLRNIAYAHPIVFTLVCDVLRDMLVEFSSLDQGATSRTSAIELAAIAHSAQSWLDDVPAAVRERLAEDTDLLARLGLEQSTLITLGADDETKFRIEDIYHGAAVALNSGERQNVVTTTGLAWSLIPDTEQGLCSCTREGDAMSFDIDMAGLVADAQEVRQKCFGRVSRNRIQDNVTRSQWCEEIAIGPLGINRIKELEKHLANSPGTVYDDICSTLSSGSAGLQDFVPLVREYYEKLILRWSGEEDVIEFSRAESNDVPGVVFSDLLKNLLVRSAHSTLVPRELVIGANSEDLRVVLKELSYCPDMWSMVGVIEALLQRTDAATGLADLIDSRIAKFVTQVHEDSDRVRLTSALFVMTDVTLNSSGIFVDVPVYWRRLASSSHAAQLERAVLESGTLTKNLLEWMESRFRRKFLSASLVDLRTEPKWAPLFGSESQLRQELVGRVKHALDSFILRLGADHACYPQFVIHAHILDGMNNVWLSTLPGPLEGGSTRVHGSLPPQVHEQAAAALADDALSLVEIVAFVSHVGCLDVLSVDLRQKLASVVMRLSECESTPEDEARLDEAIWRVAIAAAGHRDENLAEAGKALLRSRESLALELKFDTGMMLCAAIEDGGRWAIAAADHARWIASVELSKAEALYVIECMTNMSSIDQALRLVFATTVARLRAMAGRRG